MYSPTPLDKSHFSIWKSDESGFDSFKEKYIAWTVRFGGRDNGLGPLDLLVWNNLINLPRALTSAPLSSCGKNWNVNCKLSDNPFWLEDP